MKFAQIAAMAGVLALQFACTDGGTDTPDDTFGDTANDIPTPVAGDPLIQIIDPSGCASASSGSFDFGIETENWAGLAILTIWDTSFDPAFDEEHIMEHGDFDPNGAWDQWSVSLTEGVSLAQQVPSQSTIFQCENASFLTYAIEVTSDAAGTNVTDCAVFGHNPAELMNGTWPDGGEDNTNNTVIGNRFANCLNWN